MSRFSRTVRFGKIPRPSGMRHTPARASCTGEAPVMSQPSSNTLPAVGRSSPLITFSNELLPAPLGPRMATSAPPGTVRSIACNASTPS